MGTNAQKFWAQATASDWDGTDPSGGDVRHLSAVGAPAENLTTTVDLGTSGTKTITFDPFTSGRTTTGITSAFGWAINISGSDGMDGTASAKRVVPAGVWQFLGQLATTGFAATLNDVTMLVYVYRVAASPSTTRTELFNVSSNLGLVNIRSTPTLYDFSSSSQPEVVLEAGETIQVTYAITGTGQTGGVAIELRVGGTIGTTRENAILVPSPGVRTRHLTTVTVTGVGTAARGNLAVTEKTITTTGVGTATVARQTTAARTVTVTGVGTVAAPTKAVTKNPITVTGVGTVAGQVQIPFRLIPDSSDYSGSDPSYELAGVIRNQFGSPIEGAVVKLFRQDDDVKVATTTSAADGSYSFTRDSSDPYSYYVVSYQDGADPQTHNTSDRDQTPVPQ